MIQPQFTLIPVMCAYYEKASSVFGMLDDGKIPVET